MRSHRSYVNGCGTHGLPRSAPYSTMISRPPGRSIRRTDWSTGCLSRTKCSELAITTPSRSRRSRGWVKSATRTSKSRFSACTLPASLSTAVMSAPGPRICARAYVNAPSPAPRSAHRPPASPTPSSISATRSFRFNFFAHTRRDLGDKPAHHLRIFGDEEGIHAVLEHQLYQNLGRLLAGIQDAPDGARVTPGFGCRLVDALVAFDQLGRLDVAERRHPSVREAADQGEHARSVCAEPDPDLMGRGRSRVRALEPVELSGETEAMPAAPEQADDLDRLLEGADRLARSPNRSAIRLDPFPEPSGTHPELEPATAQHVERRGGLGQHGGRPKRKVGDVRKDRDAFGPHRDRYQKRPRVEEAALIGMVLDSDDVEAELVGEHGGFQRLRRRHRGDEHTEAHRLAVVHLRTTSRAQR